MHALHVKRCMQKVRRHEGSYRDKLGGGQVPILVGIK